MQSAPGQKHAIPVYKPRINLETNEKQVECDTGIAGEDEERDSGGKVVFVEAGCEVMASIVKKSASRRPECRRQGTKGAHYHGYHSGR